MSDESNVIIVTRRVTTPFLEAMPPQIAHFDAYMYAIVKRKDGKDLPEKKFGTGVRIDPAEFHWKHMAITVNIPLNINHGIANIDDLDDGWFEALEAAFLALMYGCLP